jgi:hypothetical protein
VLSLDSGPLLGLSALGLHSLRYWLVVVAETSVVTPLLQWAGTVVLLCGAVAFRAVNQRIGSGPTYWSSCCWINVLILSSYLGHGQKNYFSCRNRVRILPGSFLVRKLICNENKNTVANKANCCCGDHGLTVPMRRSLMGYMLHSCSGSAL